MKKLFPLAVLGAAVGAAAYFFNANNKKHVERTIDALDEISKSAEETVDELANRVVDVKEEIEQ